MNSSTSLSILNFPCLVISPRFFPSLLVGGNVTHPFPRTRLQLMLMMLTSPLVSGLETHCLLSLWYYEPLSTLSPSAWPTNMLISMTWKNTIRVSCFHLKQLSSFPFSSLLLKAIDNYIALLSTFFTFLRSSEWGLLSHWLWFPWLLPGSFPFTVLGSLFCVMFSFWATFSGIAATLRW